MAADGVFAEADGGAAEVVDVGVELGLLVGAASGAFGDFAQIVFQRGGLLAQAWTDSRWPRMRASSSDFWFSALAVSNCRRWERDSIWALCSRWKAMRFSARSSSRAAWPRS